MTTTNKCRVYQHYAFVVEGGTRSRYGGVVAFLAALAVVTGSEVGVTVITVVT